MSSDKFFLVPNVIHYTKYQLEYFYTNYLYVEDASFYCIKRNVLDCTKMSMCFNHKNIVHHISILHVKHRVWLETQIIFQIC